MRVNRWFLNIIICFALVMLLLPGYEVLADVDGEYYNYSLADHYNYNPKPNYNGAYWDVLTEYTPVHFNGTEWFILDDKSESATSGTLLLLSKNVMKKDVMFNTVYNKNEYKDSMVKALLEKWLTGNGRFAAVAGAIADTDLPDVDVTGAKLFILSEKERIKIPYIRNMDFLTSDHWWTRTPAFDPMANSSSAEYFNVYVSSKWPPYYRYESPLRRNGVRPALNLRLDKVTYDKLTRTFLVNQEVEAPTPATGLKYSGKMQKLLTSVPVVKNGNTKGDIKYSLDNRNWSTDIPKASDAGVYTVYYKVEGNDVFASFFGSVDVYIADGGVTDRITISQKPELLKVNVKDVKVTVTCKKIKDSKKNKALIRKIKKIQLQYSTDKSFKKKVFSKKIGKFRTKVTLKLRPNKTYYLRGRYIGKDGVSRWSKTRKVKTKSKSFKQIIDDNSPPIIIDIVRRKR